MSSNLTKALIVLVVLVVVAVVIRLRMGPSDAKPSPSVGGYYTGVMRNKAGGFSTEANQKAPPPPGLTETKGGPMGGAGP